MTLRTRALIAVIAIVFGGQHFDSASADIVSGSLTDNIATVNGGGVGGNNRDYFGQVGSVSPAVRIVGDNTDLNMAGSISPEVGDIIGRDLVSFSANFTGGWAEWVVNLPSVGSEYVPGTFGLSASFNSNEEFNGRNFNPRNPNAIDFALFFDGAIQSTFQAQSGVHSSASLSGGYTNGAPISRVRVRMTLPETNSFNQGAEAFRVYNDSLSVSYSFETLATVLAIPEPASSSLFGFLAVLGWSRRTRSQPSVTVNVPQS